MQTAKRREQFDMRDDDGARDDHAVPTAYGYCLLRRNPAGKEFLDVRTLSAKEKDCAQLWATLVFDNPNEFDVHPAVGVVMVTVTAQIRN